MVLRPLATCLQRFRQFPTTFRSRSAMSAHSSPFNPEATAREGPANAKTSSPPGQRHFASASRAGGKEKQPKKPPVPPKSGDKGAGTADQSTEVLFSTCGCNALITLNRPKQMNALSHSMAKTMFATLNKWKSDKNVIVVKGSGAKAFCAGGDVVHIAKDRTGQVGKAFFRDEYKLNAAIGCLEVPYVSIYNGVVMGGGVGLSIHGKYRIATESSVFAMPETQIGFFPDVGVSHFLSRMPDNLGVFLGLTGHRVKGYDLVHLGLATHFCTECKLEALEKDLLKDEGEKCVCDIIQRYHEESVKSLKNCQPPRFMLEEIMSVIVNCFCGDCMEVIMEKLKTDTNCLSRDILASLKKYSPLSLKVTLKQIQEARDLDLFNCLNVDYRIASRFMEGKDFYEGVRALLIDKDKKPKWQHSCLAQVTDEEVCCYFRELPPNEELNLPSSLQC